VKKFFLILPLLFAIAYGQPGHRRNNPYLFHQLKPTVQVLPVSDSQLRIFYLYRIPYPSLVFEREGDLFEAEVRILAEVSEGDKFITRDYKDVKISVNDFNETKGNEEFLQGFITFDLSPENYFIKGTVTDLNSTREIEIIPVEIHGLRSFETEIYRPIVIKSDSKCNGKNFPQIVNYGGSIPYSSNDYQLVIPVRDTTVKYVTVQLRNKNMEPVSKKIDEAYTTKISISNCKGKLFIDENNEIEITKNFVLRDFSHKLNEGPFLLTVKTDNNEEEIDYPLSVFWLEKPFSLRNPETAIELLKYIEGDSVVSNLLDADEEDYPQVLQQFWKHYDPTPETSFNELMEEYYSRVDYAALEFRGITKKNGLSTDRGRIYVKFGKPDKVERYSNDYGYMIERWIYDKPQMKFIFVDKMGTGNFVLIEG